MKADKLAMTSPSQKHQKLVGDLELVEFVKNLVDTSLTSGSGPDSRR